MTLIETDCQILVTEKKPATKIIIAEQPQRNFTVLCGYLYTDGSCQLLSEGKRTVNDDFIWLEEGSGNDGRCIYLRRITRENADKALADREREKDKHRPRAVTGQTQGKNEVIVDENTVFEMPPEDDDLRPIA
jgi:hypothetical protein